MSWAPKPLREILEQSGGHRAGNQDLPVLSITMKHGLVDQADKFKKRIASSDTSNYRIAYKNELVVGFPIDEGVLGFQTKYPAGIVSPAYDVWKLRREAECHIPYLERYLRSSQARSTYASRMQGAVARRRSLTKTDFLNLEVPFPSLADQIRIAHLLSKVEKLIAQRKQHLQQLDELLKSVFLEMFGDPVRNEKRWPINPLFTYMSELPNNGLYKPQSSYGSGTKIIRIDSFYDGVILNIEGLKRVEISDAELLRFEIRSFDILVNRVNSIERLGKIGVVPAITESVVYESNMMRFRLNHESMLPRFLMHFWQTPYLKSQINRKAKKAVNQASVNQQDVTGLLVPQPPIDLQKKFSTIVERVEAIKFRYQSSLNDFEALYGTLGQKAFKGELDLSRVYLVETLEPKPNEMTSTQLTQPEAPAIRLPETDLLLAALDDREQIKPLIGFWLQAFIEQLGDRGFSVNEFMRTAESRAEESHPDRDFELGADAYDLIKIWVFEALGAGRLEQVYPSKDTRVALRNPQSGAER